MAVTGTVTTAGLIVTGHQGGDGSASRGKGLGGTKGTRGSWKGDVPGRLGPQPASEWKKHFYFISRGNNAGM